MKWIALVLALTGCALDEGHIVNVAPSAHDQMEVIAETVDKLNALAGRETWWVRAVDHADRLDGEIIVRQDDGVRVTDGGDFVGGKTNRTSEGVIIRIPKNVSVRAMAHELGHAGGLGHVKDETNLMFKRVMPGEWHLTEEQLDDIR